MKILFWSDAMKDVMASMNKHRLNQTAETMVVWEAAVRNAASVVRDYEQADALFQVTPSEYPKLMMSSILRVMSSITLLSQHTDKAQALKKLQKEIPSADEFEGVRIFVSRVLDSYQ